MSIGDWFQLGGGLAVFYIAFSQKLNNDRARKTAEKASLERAQQTIVLDQVHKLTNSAMTAQKKALMLATQMVASLTGKVRDQAAAELARLDYENQIAAQSDADKASGI